MPACLHACMQDLGLVAYHGLFDCFCNLMQAACMLVDLGLTDAYSIASSFCNPMQAACMLVDLGLDGYRVDKAIAGFGMPMGPFRQATSGLGWLLRASRMHTRGFGMPLRPFRRARCTTAFCRPAEVQQLAVLC